MIVFKLLQSKLFYYQKSIFINANQQISRFDKKSQTIYLSQFDKCLLLNKNLREI